MSILELSELLKMIYDTKPKNSVCSSHNQKIIFGKILHELNERHDKLKMELRDQLEEIKKISQADIEERDDEIKNNNEIIKNIRKIVS